MGNWIPCMCCGQQYVSDAWSWYVCDNCGYRICPNCLNCHSGPYAMNGGYKCSQCMMGHLHLQDGVRSFSKSTPTPEGIILTNTAVIARKYYNTSAEDVREIIQDFIDKHVNYGGLYWHLLDIGSDDLQGIIPNNASWMEYAQLLSEYADGVGIRKCADTPVFIIGGSDVIPMPDIYSKTSGDDPKNIIDADFMYCFPIDYAWKKVSLDDAIFNVARFPLDYVEQGRLNTTVQMDLGGYFDRVLQSIQKGGIEINNALMTTNTVWSKTSADVIAQIPHPELKNDGVITSNNMFCCPKLNVKGHEEDFFDRSVRSYRETIKSVGMLFVNLHGSPEKSTSGYLADDGSYGLTLKFLQQLEIPVINAFPCYGARYGKFHFDANPQMPDQTYDRDDSMLLTAFYRSKTLLFVGSCNCSMCSKSLFSDSLSADDILMPAGYGETVFKLYASYLLRGTPAGKAMLQAKIDYLNYRARYENIDLVWLTIWQFNLFGCPTVRVKSSSTYFRGEIKEMNAPAKELPTVYYKTEYNRSEQGIDGVLLHAQSLVDDNLRILDEKIRALLYNDLGIKKEDLMQIESVEYNGQISYNFVYQKHNPLYPDFYIVRTDKNGVTEVLQSR